MVPTPLGLGGLTDPCSYSRLFFSNQLPTSNSIETPAIIQGFELNECLRVVVKPKYCCRVEGESLISASIDQFQ